jgi:alpha-1,2-mannosyltransferase
MLVVALLVFLAYVTYRGASRKSDFKYVYGPARFLSTTGTLNVGNHARYPITFHVILAPLAALPLGVAVAIWAGLSVTAVGALPAILCGLTGIAPRRQLVAWALAAPFFADALVLGQSDPINVFLVTCGLLAARKERGITAAGLIGLAGLIKLLPLFHWATLLSRRKSWDVWLGMALVCALGIGGLVAVVGWKQALDGVRTQAGKFHEHQSVWAIVARGSDLRPNNESIPITLVRAFADHPSVAADAFPLALPHVPVGWLITIWYTILAALAAGWLWAVRCAAHIPPERGTLAIFALTSILMLAVTPICWNHYFLWTLPAALFLVHRRRLMLTAAVVSLAITFWAPARAVGGHMLMALGLFCLVVHDTRVACRAGSELYRQMDSGQRGQSTGIHLSEDKSHASSEEV